METPITTDKPVLASLREMEIGDSISWPMHRMSYIRSICVTFGTEWGKKFTTKLNRAERTISVTRTA